VSDVPHCERFYLSCDYGTKNPFSVGLWGICGEKMYRIDEIYYSSVLEGEQKTDEEYYEMLKDLVGERKVEKIFIDPSAASFIQCIKRHGELEVVGADNDVLVGIKTVSQLLKDKKIFIHKRCENIIKEFSLYSWKQNCEKDMPIKENDHAMDDMRYFVMSVEKKDEDENFSVFASVRR
ncbi:MAG: PBSX family phage terminase large subunit, partial [Oscillospiraceae bacterium]